MARFRILSVAFVWLALILPAQALDRTEVPFPDLPGYTTLRCDFHMHTIFSDGEVWPTVRVREAWCSGLDAIAITDHVEHQSGRSRDVNKADGNRPYELAKPEAEKRGLLLLRGGEITRMEPHGHFNAIGIKDPRPLDVKDPREAIRLANEQGAFVIWNHPPEKDLANEKDSAPQIEYLAKGWMHGIEVFNGARYYPCAQRWCQERSLTMMANTDLHGLMSEKGFEPAAGHHRTMTLVFAKERSEAAILEALRARRTVVFGDDMLAGEEAWLRPLVEASIQPETSEVTLKKNKAIDVMIRNRCAVNFILEANGALDGVAFPPRMELPAGQSAALKLSVKPGTSLAGINAIAIPYAVKNALVTPDKPLDIIIQLKNVPAR